MWASGLVSAGREPERCGWLACSIPLAKPWGVSWPDAGHGFPQAAQSAGL